jgi:hypothetical protein
MRRLSLLEGFDASGLSWEQLWLRYVVADGSQLLPAMADQVGGIGGQDPGEHDIIARALNEHLLDSGIDREVAYSLSSGG